MALVYIDIESDPAVNDLGLVISQGTTVADVKVALGAVTIAGAQYMLGDDEEYTIQDRTGESTIVGYLIYDSVATEVRVIVDDFLDGEDSYNFDTDSDHKLLAVLFQATIPPNTTDMNTVTWNVTRFVPLSAVDFTLPE